MKLPPLRSILGLVRALGGLFRRGKGPGAADLVELAELAVEVTEDLTGLTTSERPPPLPERYSEAPVPLSAKDVERQREQARRAARAFPTQPLPAQPLPLPPRVPGQAPPRKR